MSIPVEKRELSDGWVLSCHGEDGGGLTLTDVTITRENLVCQIMGGVTLFFPMFAENEPENATRILVPKLDAEIMDIEKTNVELEEESVLDHIKLLITNAQQHGCWKVGVGGVCQVSIVPAKFALSFTNQYLTVALCFVVDESHLPIATQPLFSREFPFPRF